ncbi:RNA polymerase sigma factor [Spirosoma agri]|uniref:RNA polymerase sigma factor n=1 Tax=Spirosoma agri TaxID=1987381 RepID=A0A6M0II07_9BACT|nr:RNA polymerase sigma factor [Spirosoma agri]NEU67824.1 RNA polymerase sigma factor [Spirosoma agri]
MKKIKLADEQLVRSFQHTNSADSFEALYSRYVSKVYQKCLSITKDSEVAQDYTQDIFLKVFNKLDTFQNQSSFSTWLYAVAHHYCLDQIRLGKRLSTELLSDDLTHSVAEVDLHDTVEGRMRILESVLGELPEDEVTLLRLKHEHGLSIQAISQQVNLSESAVEMRLKRTRDKVQRLYADRFLNE